MNENAGGVRRSNTVIAVAASVHRRRGPVVGAAQDTPRRRPRIGLRVIISGVGVVVVRSVARLQLVEVRIQSEADVAGLLWTPPEIFLGRGEPRRRGRGEGDGARKETANLLLKL